MTHPEKHPFMRRHWAFTGLVLLILATAALSGCNLSLSPHAATPRVVTATLPATTLGILDEPPPTAITPPTLSAALPALPSATPPVIMTPVPTGTPSPTGPPTFAPPPTFTALPPTPVPTRTLPGPTAPPPLDDGSGGLIPGTGNAAPVMPVAGVRELPETLYYLSDAGDLLQVWRLRVGISHPDQMTFSPTGVAAFDVAPDGTLAYVATDGGMVVGGIPVVPPVGPEGTPPTVTSLAWSPGGDWLAYTLYTPISADTPRGSPAVDGLWLRNSQGSTVQLLANSYAADPAGRVFTGPIDWRPDGTELLVRYTTGQNMVYGRVDITANTLTPVWSATLTRADSMPFARWNLNGNAIIASGAGDLLRIDPGAPTPQTLLGADAGLWPEEAQQLIDGTVFFVGSPVSGGARQLYVLPYVLPPGQSTPTPATEALTPGGKIDFLWDLAVPQMLIVAYETADARLGTGYLRDQSGAFHDLTPLTGPVGAPRWGPAFRPGDMARVQTTRGDTLNLRDTPGGTVLLQLVSGSQVMITGGPRAQGGYRWWRVQVPDGTSGWAAESVLDEQGARLRTLVPVE
jgi:hypothetical protein